LLERGGELEEAAVPDVAVIGAGAVRIAEDARLGPEDVSATMGSRTDSAGKMESRCCTTGSRAGNWNTS
jgi:hypothetical protein